MKVRVKSSSPEVAVAGLGLIKTGDWVEVTKAQEEKFELFHGVSLADSSLETKKTVTKKEAS